MKVGPSFDHVIQDLAMACCDYEVVHIFPEDGTSGGAEASKRRPPPQPVAERFEVTQGTTSAPTLSCICPLGCRGRPLLAREQVARLSAKHGWYRDQG
eukprot:4662590-Amphidinium_carterae.2